MTKHDLKELAAMGAELGAAKAENDRLRGLLDGVRKLTKSQRMDNLVWSMHEGRIKAALSHQPKPTNTYTAVEMATAAAQGFRDGQAAVEQAAAQGERQAFEARMVLEAGPGAADLWIKGNPGAGYSNERVNDHRFGWVACLEWMATRPAQTEQQPSTTQKVLDLILEQCRYWHGRDEARRGGFACLYAEAKAVADNAAPIAQTATQPEQSEELAWKVLQAATDALDRRAAPHAWISQAWNAGSEVITSRRAALSAQRGEA